MLTFDAGLTAVENGTLTEGTWVVLPGARLVLPEPITTIGAYADVTVTGVLDEQYPQLQGPDTLEGTARLTGDSASRLANLVLRGSIQMGRDANLEVNGRMLVEDGELQFGNLGGQDGTPGGSDGAGSAIAQPLENAGRVQPGGDRAAGPLPLTGEYVQTAVGTLIIDFGGPTPVSEHDQLAVHGNVTLDGELDLVVIDGFQPQGGETFTIVSVTNGTIGGVFARTTGCPDAGVQYDPTSVVVTLPGPCPPPCPADVNEDCTVDVLDLLDVLLAWGPCS